jgi:hypothetical protein
MKAKTRESRLARLARLEAAVAALPKRQPDWLVPVLEAEVFRLLVAEYARPGMLLPSARPLHRAVAACLSVSPPDREMDLTQPTIASLVPEVRAELATFLRSHLGTDRGHWNTSCAWISLKQAGFPNPYLGGRQRGPTAEEWCAALSDMETLFEAMDCLMQAGVRAESWWRMHDSRDEGVRKAVRLPAEEEAALLAEWGEEGRPPDLSSRLRALREQAAAAEGPGHTDSGDWHSPA